MQILKSLRGMRTAVLLASLALAQPGMATDHRHCMEPQKVADSTYNPGQVWSYRARAGESSSTITVLRVEMLPKVGIIVHVRIDGVLFRNCTGGPAPTAIDHAPFTKAALDKSVSRQLRATSELPEFETGYNDWLTHCGGAYSITVAEMVDADDATFNAGLGCK